MKEQVRLAQKLEGMEKTTQRQLFRKITKGFDEKDSLLTDARLRIQALEAQLEAAKPKKRRKVQISPNSKFADIEAIQAARNTIAGIEANPEDSDSSDISTIISDCIELG